MFWACFVGCNIMDPSHNYDGVVNNIQLPLSKQCFYCLGFTLLSIKMLIVLLLQGSFLFGGLDKVACNFMSLKTVIFFLIIRFFFTLLK